MNRTSISLAAALAALAASAPAQAAAPEADAQLALRWSAGAQVTLGPAPELARRHDVHAKRRLMHALTTAHHLEVKAAAAAQRSLRHGGDSSKAAVVSAGRVLARLDAAGRSEVGVLRSTADQGSAEQAAAGVDLNADLTASLSSKITGSAVSGSTAAGLAASAAIADRAPRVVRGVAGAVRALASAESASTRAHVDHAIAVAIVANGRVATELSNARERGDDARDSAVAAALRATQRAGARIKALIDAGGAADHEVSANDGSADASASATLTLGEIASASASAAADVTVHSAPKR
jgi:hypothetical protein